MALLIIEKYEPARKYPLTLKTDPIMMEFKFDKQDPNLKVPNNDI